MQFINSPEGEQNPNAVFQGLGFRGWLRLVFTTRAGMIKQHDRIVDQLLERNNQACRDVGKLAALTLEQNAALEHAATLLVRQRKDGWNHEDRVAYEKVLAALEAAQIMR